MERQHGLNNQRQSLFRGHPKMNGESPVHKDIYRIDSNISGADKGFGCIKPWTKEQRESAETRQRERRKMNESLSNHIGF